MGDARLLHSFAVLPLVVQLLGAIQTEREPDILSAVRSHAS